MSGSLATFMDELLTLSEVVAARAEERGLPRLRAYRMRELSMELPAIYPWVNTSPAEWKDVSGHRHRDVLSLNVRVAVGRIDSDELGDQLLRYADVVRDVYDPAFRASQPLNGACKWADRPSLAFSTESLGDNQSFPVVEFSVTAWLDRNLTPDP